MYYYFLNQLRASKQYYCFEKYKMKKKKKIAN